MPTDRRMLPSCRNPSLGHVYGLSMRQVLMVDLDLMRLRIDYFVMGWFDSMKVPAVPTQA